MKSAEAPDFGKKTQAFIDRLERQVAEKEILTAVIKPYWNQDDEESADLVYLVAPVESANSPWKLQRFEYNVLKESGLHDPSDYESSQGRGGDFTCGRHRVRENNLIFEVRFYPNTHYVEGLVERAELEMNDERTDEQEERLAQLRSVFSHKHISLHVLNQNPSSVDEYIENRHFGNMLKTAKAANTA